MPLDELTHACQSQLATYCRTGIYEEIPGVNPERAAVYRRLVWGTVRDALEKAYPIAASSLDPETWEGLITDWFAERNPQTPYFWLMPKELYLFVEETPFEERYGLPYLRDLLLFEWIEIELFMMANCVAPRYRREGDVMRDPLVFNPEARVDSFCYPVFKRPVEELADCKGNYFLLSFRHPVSLEVSFIELSPVCTVIAELLMQEAYSGEEVIAILAKQFGLEVDDQIYRVTENFLSDLLERGALLGFKEDPKNA